MGRKRVARWSCVLLGLIAFIVIPFVLLETRLNRWGEEALAHSRDHKALSAVTVVILLASDVVLPVPSSVISTLAGVLLGWAGGAVLIWTGMTLGCAFGYGIGARVARPLALRAVGDEELRRATRLFEIIGPITLILTRAIPVLAEASTLAAGAAGMRFAAFMLATGFANACVAIAYAGIGATAVAAESFLIVFFGLALVPSAAWLVYQLLGARRIRSSR